MIDIRCIAKTQQAASATSCGTLLSTAGSSPRTEDGADDAVEGQVAGVLHFVGDVRAGSPEL